MDSPAGDPGVFRLLITGSRDWDDPWQIRDAFDRAAACAAEVKPGARLVAVHGRCDPRLRVPRRRKLTVVRWDGARTWPAEKQRALLGGDWLADLMARNLGWDVEEHPADWKAPCRDTCKPGHRQDRGGWIFCPAAGDYRNTEMAATGCDRCAAFIKNRSRGATHCAAEAEQYGTPVWRYTA